MKRQSPLKALQVAQLRCDAAVTITITGKAGSGKSTAAEIISKALAAFGHKAICIEADDTVIGTKQHDEGKDDRLYLVAVEDSKIAFKPDEKPEQATAESECDGDCEDCPGKDLHPAMKALLINRLVNRSLERAIKGM